MKALTTFSALALMAVASPASAQSWTGCYAGVQAGYAASVTDVGLTETYPVWDGEELASQTDSLGSLKGLGANGAAFGGIVGCDYQINRFVIGAFADYLKHNDHSIDLNIGGPGGLNASVDLDDQWSVGGRAGVLVNEDTLFYGLAAYTEGSTSDIKASFGDESGSFKLDDQKGWSVGAGLETRISGNLYLSGEYRYTQFDENDYKLAEGCDGACSLDASTETTVHTGLLSLKYKLGRSDSIVSAPLK
jgi:outer membrane immunogenic protein